MATYVVNMSNVQEVAAEMGVISKGVSNLLAGLNDGLAINLAEWSADSKTAYYACQQKWNAAAGDMSVQAANAQASLASITDAYAMAEYQGLGLWGA
jgi:WXG100 family type VII secretion target